MASSTRTGGNQQAQSAERRHEGKHRGTIVSDAPGRMRVRLRQEHRDPAVLGQIEQQLGDYDAVTSVATDARTGSILVHYNRNTASKIELVSALSDAGVVVMDRFGAEIVPEASTAGRNRGVVAHSAGAESVLDALTDLDRRISERTGGKVDLKLLVPAGLGLLALRQVALNGLGLAQVPGYVLLWYTFDTFYKLHQRNAGTVAQAAEQILGSESAASSSSGVAPDGPTRA